MARRAYGSKNPSTRKALAYDIAQSILAARDRGQARFVSQYTPSPQTQAEVYDWLRRIAHPVQSDEAQARRQAQQAWLDSCRAGNLRRIER